MAEKGEGVPPAEEHESEEESEGSGSEAEESEEMVDEEIFEVEKIVGRKMEQGKVKYKVRWKGYTAKDDSYEPVENLSMVMDMVDEYEKDYQEKQAKRKEERKLRKLRMEGKRLPGEESPNSDEEESEFFGLKDPFFKKLEYGLIDVTQTGDKLSLIHLRKAMNASKKESQKQEASTSGTERTERKRRNTTGSEKGADKSPVRGRGGRVRGSSRGRGGGRGRGRGKASSPRKRKDEDSDDSVSRASTTSQDSCARRPAAKRKQAKGRKKPGRVIRTSSSEESAGSYKLNDSDSSSGSETARRPPRAKTRRASAGAKRKAVIPSSPTSSESSSSQRRRSRNVSSSSGGSSPEQMSKDSVSSPQKGELPVVGESPLNSQASPRVNLADLSISEPASVEPVSPSSVEIASPQVSSPPSGVASYQEVETSSPVGAEVCLSEETETAVPAAIEEVTAVTEETPLASQTKIDQGKKKTKRSRKRKEDTAAIHTEAVCSGDASPPKMSPSRSASSPAVSSPPAGEAVESSPVADGTSRHSPGLKDAVSHSPAMEESTGRSPGRSEATKRSPGRSELMGRSPARRESRKRSDDATAAIDESSQESRLTIDLGAGGSEDEAESAPEVSRAAARKSSQEKKVPPLVIPLTKIKGCESPPAVTKQKQSVKQVAPPGQSRVCAVEVGRSDNAQAGPIPTTVARQPSATVTVKREPALPAVTQAQDKPQASVHRPGAADFMHSLSASSGRESVKMEPVREVSQPQPVSRRVSPVSRMDTSPAAFATNLYSATRVDNTSSVGYSASPVRGVSSRDTMHQSSASSVSGVRDNASVSGVRDNASVSGVKDNASVSSVRDSSSSSSFSFTAPTSRDVSATSSSAYRDSNLFSKFDMKSVTPPVKQGMSSAVGVTLSKESTETQQPTARPSTSFPKKKDMDMIWAGDMERASRLRGLDSDFELALERMDLTDIENMLMPPVEPIEITDDALKRAVKDGNQTLVEQALAASKQYDVNQPDAAGCTLLMHAVLNGYDDIMLQLVIHGADVQAKQKNGATALMLAVEHAECSTVAILLEMGANINCKDCNGETALIKAVKRGEKQILKMLLENGANFTDTTYAGYNAIQLAKVHRLADMETTLIDHITRVTAEFERQVQATLRNTAKLIQPLFPHQCFPLFESSVNKVNFRYHPTPPTGPGMGFLLFIAHARITGNEVKCRLYGQCAVTSVTLNGVNQPSLTEESNFVLMCHPLFEGENELVIHTHRDATSKAKLIVCAYKAQLISQ